MVKNVGQGNCIIVNMPKESMPNSYDTMLIDCGSTAYKKPLSYSKKSQTPIKQSDEEKTKKRKLSLVMNLSESPQSTTDEDGDKMFQSISSYIKGDIGAVVITHPDKDHYGWFSNIINNKIYKSIILGGSPEKYLSTTILDFIKNHNEKVYFTAIDGGKTEIKKIEEGTYNKANSYYYIPSQGDENPTSIIKALDFNKRFKISLLAINSNHVKNLNSTPQKVINISSKEDGTDDYNTDSIIIKILDIKSNKSIIFTGDATGVTTTRLMDHASRVPEIAEFLKSDVLISSHHGASSHGTNNEAWIRTVNPEYIIISTGGRYGHPTKKAYKASCRHTCKKHT